MQIYDTTFTQTAKIGKQNRPLDLTTQGTALINAKSTQPKSDERFLAVARANVHEPSD